MTKETRFDASLRDSSGRVIEVAVSREFDLVKIDVDGRDSITMSIYEFENLAKWVLQK